MSRLPIIRREVDGTVTDGTCEVTHFGNRTSYGDFRDLDGNELVLPPMARFEIVIEVPLGKRVSDMWVEGLPPREDGR